MTKAAHPGARASRPHPLPWVVAQFPCDGAPVHRAGGNRMGSAEAEPGRLCRSIRVEEMGEALPVLCGRDARAPGWASSHDARISRSRYRRCIRTPLIIEGGPSLFVFIRVHSCPLVVRLQKRSAVSSSNDPPIVGGGGPACLKQTNKDKRTFCKIPQPTVLWRLGTGFDQHGCTGCTGFF